MVRRRESTTTPERRIHTANPPWRRGQSVSESSHRCRPLRGAVAAAAHRHLPPAGSEKGPTDAERGTTATTTMTVGRVPWVERRDEEGIEGKGGEGKGEGKGGFVKKKRLYRCNFDF